MIYPLLQHLKYHAIKHPMVSLSTVGDITLVENRADTRYPFVNFDVVNSVVTGYAKKYTIRIWVCDRQYDPLVAFNKTELILDNIMKDIEQNNYNVTYVTYNSQDQNHGCYADFNFEQPLSNYNCDYSLVFSDNNLLLEDGSFIMLENGDLISLE